MSRDDVAPDPADVLRLEQYRVTDQGYPVLMNFTETYTRRYCAFRDAKQEHANPPAHAPDLEHIFWNGVAGYFSGGAFHAPSAAPLGLALSLAGTLPEELTDFRYSANQLLSATWVGAMLGSLLGPTGTYAGAIAGFTLSALYQTPRVHRERQVQQNRQQSAMMRDQQFSDQKERLILDTLDALTFDVQGPRLSGAADASGYGLDASAR